jgi:DNA-binding HxlR family transcriptional regulator
VQAMSEGSTNTLRNVATYPRYCSFRDTMFIIGTLSQKGRMSVSDIGRCWLHFNGEDYHKWRSTGWASKRCKFLENAGLLRREEQPDQRGRGPWVFYTLTDEGETMYEDNKHLQWRRTNQKWWFG